MLKPHDVLCVLKICCLSGREWTFRELGTAVGLSNGEAYNALGRLKASQLVYEKDGEVRLASRRLLDFLVYGVPTVFYQERGQVTRGVPTGIFAPPMSEKLGAVEGDIMLVWPTATGKSRGETLVPIYKTAPAAAATDAKLYELLALVDALRTGRTRERKMAAELMEQRIAPQGIPAEG